MEPSSLHNFGKGPAMLLKAIPKYSGMWMIRPCVRNTQHRKAISNKLQKIKTEHLESSGVAFTIKHTSLLHRMAQIAWKEKAYITVPRSIIILTLWFSWICEFVLQPVVMQESIFHGQAVYELPEGGLIINRKRLLKFVQQSLATLPPFFYQGPQFCQIILKETSDTQGWQVIEKGTMSLQYQ